MHKGFKCLDPKEGRIYISRDVVFDEHVFPFQNLYPNAGARLRSDSLSFLTFLKILPLISGMQICVMNMSYLLPVLMDQRVPVMFWLKQAQTQGKMATKRHPRSHISCAPRLIRLLRQRTDRRG